MIKKSIFEDELISGMERELVSQAKSKDLSNVTQAADYLNSAAEIFEDMGMISKSDKILNILSKLAEKFQTPSSEKLNDPHMKGLTPEKQVKNLLHHGTQFNANDGKDSSDSDDDLLNLDVGDDLEVSDGLSEMHDFEDERDSLHTKASDDDSQKENFIRKVKRDLVVNSDNFEWHQVPSHKLESHIDFNIDADSNAMKILNKNLSPEDFKMHHTKDPNKPHFKF